MTGQSRTSSGKRPRMIRVARNLLPTCLVVVVPLAGCDVFGPDEIPPIEELPRQLSIGEREVIQAGNAFAFDLLRAVVEEQGPRNVFLSPLSASYALGVLLNGADGETFRAIRETLRLDGLALEEINASYASLADLLLGLDPSIELGIANALWPKRGFPFKQTFIDRVSTKFDAHVQTLDFASPAAVDEINAWVAEETNGRIDKIIKRIRPGEVLFLTNAVYFKAPWVYAFDPVRTRGASFRLPDGSETTVPMMTRDGPVRMFGTPRFVAADLRYGGGAFSMTIIVPRGDVTVGALIDSLDAARWAEWMDRFRPNERAEISLPTFRITFDTRLNGVLKALGMTVAFDPRRADFARMYDGTRRLYVTRVDQKTFIEVNEEGTEAAAATNVGVGLVSVPPHVRADRPFLLVIRERFSGTILFIGQVMNPGAG